MPRLLEKKHFTWWRFILNRAKWQLWNIEQVDFLYFYTIQLEKIKKQKFYAKNEKNLFGGSVEIAKNKENAFSIYKEQYTTYWSSTCLVKKVLIVLDVITWWSTIESQRYTKFSYCLLWEYKNPNVKKKRTN